MASLLCFEVMDDDILKSVIEITRHRDLDSLEYSLVATLAEIITTKKIAVYKTFSADDHYGVEEILGLSTLESENDNPQYKWSDQAHVINADKMLEQCILGNKTVTHSLDDGLFRIIIPISHDNTAIGAISLHGTDEILSSLSLVKGFIKIYKNYQIFWMKVSTINSQGSLTDVLLTKNSVDY